MCGCDCYIRQRGRQRAFTEQPVAAIASSSIATDRASSERSYIGEACCFLDYATSRDRRRNKRGRRCSLHPIERIRYFICNVNDHPTGGTGNRAVQDAPPFFLRGTQGKCEVSSARRPDLFRERINQRDLGSATRAFQVCAVILCLLSREPVP